jgi:hypothetical protein
VKETEAFQAVQRYSSSILIEAAPATLYGMVSDVTRMGEWSPVCTGCWWDKGSGPWSGAWFTGRNETSQHAWETRCQVITARPGREFAFSVSGVGARWTYTFEPKGNATLVTETWHLLPEGIAEYGRRFGADAERQIRIRRDRAIDGISVTLAALKATAEGSASLEADESR